MFMASLTLGVLFVVVCPTTGGYAPPPPKGAGPSTTPPAPSDDDGNDGFPTNIFGPCINSKCPEPDLFHCYNQSLPASWPHKNACVYTGQPIGACIFKQCPVRYFCDVASDQCYHIPAPSAFTQYS